MLGSGTQSNPFIIQTPNDLDSMRNNVARNVFWELGNDIDMSSWGNWTPIAYYDGVSWKNAFEGNFDGKGFKITNLTINITNTDGIYLGLFGQYHYGTCQNIGLENFQINTNASMGCRYSGSLIGYTYGATIRNCYAKGGNVKGQDETGGLIGKAQGGILENCYSTNNVTITTSYWGGGLLGTADTGQIINNCFAASNVSYTTSAQHNGYSGFVGYVRDGSIPFSNCFWDTQTSGQANPPKHGYNPFTGNVSGVTGKTTAEMKTQSTFTNWDFTNTWLISNDYPALKVFGVPLPPAKIQTISVVSFADNIFTVAGKVSKVTKNTESILSRLNAYVDRKLSTQRNTSSYTIPINTSVQKSTRIVRSSTQNVITFINPVHTFIERKTNTFRHLLSFMDHLDTSVSVKYPIQNKGANVYVSYVQNPSVCHFEVNMTNAYPIVNPSISEVIE
ncbi:glycoside hydrolase family 55 protein [Fictibacillus phosphorivorans]|uniref:glycoside hydrolase family 55 protein n=1 Tax=Fictibacillus phosphorivorans TaxID=1221500 RepID=UPI00203EEDD9|nr:glycoside hydrolase family 55 protein [Fictibacillus phosphorivorans]MCM3719167.1 glycoside hydrolase family 55 protein [Fictibacillus phosphorivorans]MCM3776789.1 glycoside hydrolase family 55 protein [Fictibacillus phosphorivorans]